MYKQNLTLNNLQVLYALKPNQTKFIYVFAKTHKKQLL